MPTQRFRDLYSLEDRKMKFKEMTDRFPDGIPAIIEPHPGIKEKDMHLIKGEFIFK